MSQLDLFGETPRRAPIAPASATAIEFVCEVCRRLFMLERDALVCPKCGGQVVPKPRRLWAR